ncbi:SixA phosphatase family protein [Salinimicrobium oceani]|uniref:Histidine phosphatase family protein n=1 Tax=Salinimicrobium oceani TaxID=2722702 RepID=A0ABX1CT13_9FLAO|nr:phosphoglycerate mutase family protein [Salinimicrobium oceani]NJW51440.1 histidine phosphatase family protein [Salinimicrobium oceani]
MNSYFIILLSFLSMGASHNSAEPPMQESTTYYFIRHAEKDEGDPQNKDPKLTAAGHLRAEKWVDILKEVQFDLIMSTNLERTRSTAAKIAEAQGKEVQFYDPRNLNSVEFQGKTKGKTVLVVGHSNTNPAFVNAILGEEKFEALDEKEYGSLFIVNIDADGKKSAQVKYHN